MEKAPPKKRGRKPKIKPVDVDTKPKKRGRKPKNNIIVNDNPEFDGVYNEDITVKLNGVDSNILEDNIVDGYKKLVNNYEDISIDNKSFTSLICWNCSHNLNQNIYGMPLKYINNIFFTYGDFCSNGCCMRYAYDNYCDSFYYDIKANINLRLKLNNIDTHIELPPSKYSLNIYGGPLSQEEYIKPGENYDIELSDCIHINHVFSKNDNKFKNTNAVMNDLKLYRKTNDIFKNDINKWYNKQ